MGITLTSKTINSTYDSLLKLSDNDSLTGAFKVITDGLGNDTGVSLNNTGDVKISGTLTVNTRINTPLLQLTGGTGTQGELSWNADEETLDLVNNGAVLQLGQEIHIHVRNNSVTTAIPNGTPVYVAGTLGASGRLKVAPMIADGSIAPEYFIGVTTEEIEAGGDGKVTFLGKVRGFDTSGYTEGSKLYVSETVAGGWQTTEPTAPHPKLEVAFTVNKKSNGTIFVRGRNGQYLHDNHDVNITSVADKDLLVYDSTNDIWKNSKTLGNITTGTISSGNITTSGYLRGPATFVIDPAAHGDDTGEVVIAGNLRVDGETTTVNSNTVTVKDKNVVLGSGATADTDNDGAGITVLRPTIGSTASYIQWNEGTDQWDFSNDINANLKGNADTATSANSATSAGKWTTARTLTIGDTGKSVDGSGNVSWTKAEIGITKANIDALNVNADTLDGLNSTTFVRTDQNGEISGHLSTFSTIGANDNVRTGLRHYDTSAVAEGIGGQLVLGYKYYNTSYTEGAIIKMYKENSTNGEYGSGLKFQVRNHGDDLSTKMTLDPTGYLLLDQSIKSSKNMLSGLSNGTFNVNKAYLGGLHFKNGAGVSGNGKQTGITFQGDSADYAQAGIYVHNNNSSGTAMAFATTNSYSTGPQIGLEISNHGIVNINRNSLQMNGTTVIDTNRNIYANAASFSGAVSYGGGLYADGDIRSNDGEFQLRNSTSSDVFYSWMNTDTYTLSFHDESASTDTNLLTLSPLGVLDTTNNVNVGGTLKADSVTIDGASTANIDFKVASTAYGSITSSSTGLSIASQPQITFTTAATTALTIDTSQNVTFEGNIYAEGGYVDIHNVLYTRDTLRVLNAAGTGWNDWALRSSGLYTLYTDQVFADRYLNANWLYLKKASNGNGIQMGAPAGGFVNMDARDFAISSNTGARLHRWNRNSDDTAYLPYYERWYDGDSYHSIGVEGNTWRFDSNVYTSGKLGIGTDNPSKGLHIYTSANEGMFLQGTGAGVWFDMQSASGHLWSYGAENGGTGIYNRSGLGYQFYINNSGYTGIGTNVPDQRLQVNGNIRIQGVGNALYFDTTSGVSTNGIKSINDYETVLFNGRGSAGFAVIGNNSIRLGFGTSYTAAQSSIYINSSGYVGLGVTSPNAKLEVDGDSIFRGTLYKNTNMTTAGVWGSDQIQLNTLNTTDTTGWQGISFDTSTTVNYGWSIGANRSTSGHGSFRFYQFDNSATGTERLTLHQSGNVGIGESSPVNKLAVIKSNSYAYYSSSTPAYVSVFQDVNPTLLIANDNNTDGAASTLRLGNAHDNYYSRSAYVQATQGAGINVYRLHFGTSNVTSAAVTRMTIDEYGRVGVADTSPLSKFEVAGSIKSTNRDSLHTGEAGVTLAYDTSESMAYIETWQSKPLTIRTYNYQAYSIGGAEKLRINSDGVGVKVTSPYHDFHVNGDAGIQGGSFYLGDIGGSSNGMQFYVSGGDLRIYRNQGSFGGSSTAENLSLKIYSGSGYTTTIVGSGQSVLNGALETKDTITITKGHSDSVQQGSSVYLVGGTGSSYTQLQQGVGRFTIWGFNGSSWGEKFTIRHSDGYVGINTTNPQYLFHVNGTGYFNSTLTVGSYFKSYSSIGAGDNVRTGIAHYDETAMAEGVGGQLVLGYKYTASGGYTEGAIIKMYKENSESGQYGSGMRFQVRNTGQNLSTKMRLDPSGNLTVASDIVAYYSFSDARLKTNVKPLENSLEKVKQLQGVSYEWIDGERKGKTEVGLIAQEVEKVVPEVVREQKRLGDDTEYKTVDYEKMVGVLIEAIKEQQEQIDELKRRLDGSTN